MERKDFGAKPLTLPQPVWIIATYDEDGTPDAMNAAWGGISEQTEISVCLSASHKTVSNFLRSGAFTINMADAEHIAACDYFGIASGNTVKDKIKAAGLTVTSSDRVAAPIINELPVSLECKVIEYNRENCILKGEIINVSVREAVLTDGKLDMAKAKPVCFDPFNNAYHVIGEAVGGAWKVGKSLL